MSEVFEEASVERVVRGGFYILISGILAAVFGWLFAAVASRADVGVGGDLLGYLTIGTALHVIAICISGGFHQALSKYVSEALVESKEKALRFAKSGFLIFNITGLIAFAIFFGVALYILPHNLGYGLVFAIMSIVYYFTFFRDNFLGNLAAVQRFDYIAIQTFIAGIAGVITGCLILFLLPQPLNAYLLPLVMVANVISSSYLLIRYGKKTVPYPIKSVLRGAHRKETIELLKYMLYCVVPNIIFSNALLWIQNLWYGGIYGFETIIVSSNGLILGYASVIYAINQFGWPQIPAVSEAKAKGDFKLIDDYIKNTLHTGFNITALFLVIYVGLSHSLLYLFHGPEYLIAHIPFIINCFSVAILGVEFLICSLLIGLGEGRKAAILIAILTIIQIIMVPCLIFLGRYTFGPSDPVVLYAGPISLLIASIVIFPTAFHYLKQFSHNPPKEYLSTLGRASVSVGLTLTIYVLMDIFLFPQTNLIVGFIIRAAILFGFFTLSMIFFAGYNDKDLDIYAISVFKPVVRGMKWLLHHSPFYQEEIGDTSNGVRK